MNDIKKQILTKFWSIYDTDGTVQALSWLDSLKYYEEFCCDEETRLSKEMENISIVK